MAETLQKEREKTGGPTLAALMNFD